MITPSTPDLSAAPPNPLDADIVTVPEHPAMADDSGVVIDVPSGPESIAGRNHADGVSEPGVVHLHHAARNNFQRSPAGASHEK